MIKISFGKSKKPRMEFSKKILVVAWLSGTLVILYALWLTYKMVIDGHSGDVSLVSIILTGGFTEIAAGTGFYYWKARKENEIKLQKIYGNKFLESESDNDED